MVQTVGLHVAVHQSPDRPASQQVGVVVVVVVGGGGGEYMVSCVDSGYVSGRGAEVGVEGYEVSWSRGYGQGVVGVGGGVTW